MSMSPLQIEMLADVHRDEILADAARESLAARMPRRPGYALRSRLARALRGMAVRLDGVEHVEQPELAGI